MPPITNHTAPARVEGESLAARLRNRFYRAAHSLHTREEGLEAVEAIIILVVAVIILLALLAYFNETIFEALKSKINELFS